MEDEVIPGEEEVVEPAVDIDEAPDSIEPGPGPWTEDLKARFQDPETFSSVDQYMRETVQPYVEKLETASKPNREATRLWEEFHKDPHNTFAQVTREIHSDRPELAEQIIALANGEELPEPDMPDVPDDVEPDDGLTAEQRGFIEEGIRSKELTQYNELLSGVEKELSDPEREGGPVIYRKPQFEHMLVMAEGNLEQAKEMYVAWVDDAKQTFGLNIPAPGSLSLTPETPAPPPTIGSGTAPGGGITPPQEPSRGGDINSAIDDMFTSTPPPSVGS